MALNVIVKWQDLWLFIVNAPVSDASLLASVGFYLAADTRAALKSAVQLLHRSGTVPAVTVLNCCHE